MSNTNKDKLRGKLRRIKNTTEYLKHHRTLPINEQKTIINYDKNPSWWNHDMNNVPKRNNDKKLCKLVLKGQDGDDMLFSDDKKPSRWYW